MVISQGTLVVGNGKRLGSNAVTINDGNTTQNPYGYEWWGSDHSTGLLTGGSNTVPNAVHVTNNGNGTSYLGGNTANSSTFSGPITLDKTSHAAGRPRRHGHVLQRDQQRQRDRGGRGRLHRHRGLERLEQL